MPALTRGPLPASVYWRRRLVVLTVALLLLWTALHVFGGGGGGTPKADSAADLTGASTSPSPTARPSGKTSPTASNSASASGSASGSPSADAPASTSSAPVVSETPSPTVLPSPSGACPASDVSVTPSVTGATAGTSVAIVLSLRTFSTPACTWHVSHKTMQVKVTTAGGADVWSTVQCPAAMPTSDVVVYKDTATPVTVTWSGRRADSDCSTHTAWSKLGTYAVTGVALGSTPDQASFTLGAMVETPPAQPSTTPTAPAASTTPTSQPPATAPTTTAPATAASGGSSTGSTTPKKKHKKKHPLQD